MKKFLAKLTLCSVLLSTAGIHTVGAEESKNLNIQLQIDNNEMKLNGEKTTVEKPFLDNGSTLVPLRVITAAFGAAIKWNEQTNSIEISYGNQVILLTIGSTKGIVDGKTIEIPVAPQLKNGTTMVPLRFISETFGAKVSFDSDSQSITIAGNLVSEDKKDSSNMDEDAGKTYIGDSYYQWTMKYPSGLVKATQAFKENVLGFTDAKDEYILLIGVRKVDSRLSNDALLKTITDGLDRTIIEKTFVTNAKYPYARVVSKDSESSYYEYRAIQSGGKVYDVRLIISDEENYNNDQKRRFYTDLLDSFTPEFDTGKSSSIKDVSTVVNGSREYSDANSGISLKVPASWNKSEGSEWLSLYNAEEQRSVDIRVTSIVEGDTLDQWVKREETHTKNTFLPEYIQIKPIKDVILSGLPAKELKYTYHYEDPNKKQTVYGLYLFSGKYKYEVDIQFDNSNDDEALAKSIMETIVIKSDNLKLGTIEDNRDFMDQVKTSTIRNKKYNFEGEIPDSWTDTNDRKSSSKVLEYTHLAGRVVIHATDGILLDEATKAIDKFLSNQSSSKDFKVIEKGSGTIFGVPAKKYVYEGKIKNVSHLTTSYVFEKDGTIFTLDAITLKAKRTDYLLKIQDNVLNSFKFN
ncbi:MAG: hypothetical protein K0S39_315 [Paenibacillus sp.]|nr:hypothetical protein [Paenibacillus sp.]